MLVEVEVEVEVGIEVESMLIVDAAGIGWLTVVAVDESRQDMVMILNAGV